MPTAIQNLTLGMLFVTVAERKQHREDRELI